MRWALGAWRLARTLVHLAHGMAVVVIVFAWGDDAGRQARVQWWSAKLLRALGVRWAVQGAPRAGATLLVANHVSWLDIVAIHAAAPRTRFVSKADVLHWPLIGWLAARAGTLFIEREKKRDALRVVHQMADALRAGDAVAVFPEGTTGPGGGLLAFHANLLQAAIVTATPVQPLLLRYRDAAHKFSPAAEFVGDTTLLRSLWRIACAEDLSVELEFLEAQASGHADRRALAAHLRQTMAVALASIEA